MREAARPFAWILLGQVPPGWLRAGLKELYGDNRGAGDPFGQGKWGPGVQVPGVEPPKYGCGLIPREGPQGSSL